MPTRLYFQCTAIREQLSGATKLWWVTLAPYPFPDDVVDGQIRYGGRDGGEFTLRVFAEALARSFQVGEMYTGDFGRVDAPR